MKYIVKQVNVACTNVTQLHKLCIVAVKLFMFGATVCGIGRWLSRSRSDCY